MEFSIPTNWSEEFLTALQELNPEGKAKEVYGKLAFDDFGGGRIGFSLSCVSRSAAKEHINRLRRMGLGFNYLLNSVCMDNLEFTAQGQARIRRLMDWLVKMDIRSVTVANPYIIIWLRKNYPFISITVSAIANTDSLNRAKFFENLGVDKITFPGPSVNRNFALIKALKKSISCEIQLIANNPCLLHCPNQIYHYAMNSHASQKWHKCKGFLLDYYVLMCRFRRLENVSDIILSDWIRPEDICFYEKLGVDSIKLVDRRLSSEAIINIVKAYFNRSYRGNLMDLFPIFQGKTFNEGKGLANSLLTLRSLLSVNPLKLLKYSKLMSKLEIFIDNQSLEGFLEGMPSECDSISCGTCNYCKEVADKVVKINKDYLAEMLSLYRETMENLF